LLNRIPPRKQLAFIESARQSRFSFSLYMSRLALAVFEYLFDRAILASHKATSHAVTRQLRPICNFLRSVAMSFPYELGYLACALVRLSLRLIPRCPADRLTRHVRRIRRGACQAHSVGAAR